MKLAVKNLNFEQLPILEFGSLIPIGFYNYVCTIVFNVYLDNGDLLEYTMKIRSEKFTDFIEEAKRLAENKIKELTWKKD